MTFKKYMGKKRKFFSFSNNDAYPINCINVQVVVCTCSQFWLHLNFVIIFVNPFPNKPCFLRVCSRSRLKTLWEKEKLQCFLPFWRTFCHFYKILNCCLQTLSVWKILKFVVWERVNSVPQKPDVNDPEKESIWKHCGKRRTWWCIFSYSYNVFYPFPNPISIIESHLFCHLQMI